MTNYFRRAARALVALFLIPRRLAQLGAQVEKRFDRIERKGLRSLAARQARVEAQLAQLARHQAAFARGAGSGVASKRGRSMVRRELPDDVAGPPRHEDLAVPGMDCPTDQVLVLGECPVCGEADRTPVCEYNRMITMPRLPDAAAARYDYALCHGCGVVYASRRPTGPRFAWLLEHFEESLGRVASGHARGGKLVLNSYGLDGDGRARLAALAARGVFVSEHDTADHKSHLWQLESDRMANSPHLETLGSLLDLKAPRVLEIRSRLGSILAGLKRLYDAETYAMPLFPSQQFLIQEVYGIPADTRLDFDQFTIPYAPPFDLIVANHMITHAVRPKAFLETVHAALSPGGHAYFYNEPLEREYLDHDKSMFNTLNAFHLQAFDRESFARALAANGFEVVYMASRDSGLVCLARRAETPVPWEPMTPRARARRSRAYRSANDLAILLLPDHARPRLADQWRGALHRGLEDGFVAADARGRFRLMVRPAVRVHPED